MKRRIEIDGIKYIAASAIVRRAEPNTPKRDRAKNAGKEFKIYESTQNKNRRVQNIETGDLHKLPVAYEGENYYHLGATDRIGEAEMVLKADWCLVPRKQPASVWSTKNSMWI